MNASDDLIPDFCRWRPLLLLAFIMELVAVVLTLAAGLSDDVLDRFILSSLYLQWMGLFSAAALCGTRRRLQHAPVQVMFGVAWTLLVVINGLISAAGYEILLRSDAHFALNPEPRFSFLFRHLCMSALVSLMVLRFFWVRHQWGMQLRAESESRYQALQARIRPHFLFNSLNSIAALAGSRPQDAEALIEDVAELLRASLDRRSRRAPLADELALVRAYLRIEQARLNERLEVDWQIADDTLALAVPSLSVQPLVENAIYHGVERRPMRSVLRIAAQRQGGELLIEITNPKAEPGAAPRAGQHIAVDNIVQRLALIYGEQASLKLSEEGDRFVARLRLPEVKNA
ncbi:MAG: histidine kinase [Hydrocarboniphaga effusa]|nr:histidine kinase [Hydrocarboniphaga effusa]